MSHLFCRILLKETMKEVRKHTTPAQRKAAWTYDYGDGFVEFHGPDGFYWTGKGCCRWEARAEGWGAWMEKKKISDGDC